MTEWLRAQPPSPWHGEGPSEAARPACPLLAGTGREERTGWPPAQGPPKSLCPTLGRVQTSRQPLALVLLARLPSGLKLFMLALEQLAQGRAKLHPSGD